MTTREPQAMDPHDAHDRLLIAARAAGDAAGGDLDRAERLLETCDRCRGLLGDLRAIAAASRDLPPAARPAALDFRLTPDRAAALGRGGRWRRLLRPFSRTGNDAVRPLAAALTTLGVAGLLLAALPMLPLGGSAAGPAGAAATTESRDIDQGAYGAAAAPTGEPSPDPFGLKVEQPPVAAGPTDGSVAGAAGSGATAERLRTDDRDAGSGGADPLVIVSSAFLGAGLALLLLRRAARRVC
jgi:hypothetical protein